MSADRPASYAVKRVACPLCRRRVGVLFEQTASGMPTGGRFLEFHPIYFGKGLVIECPASGAVVSFR